MKTILVFLQHLRLLNGFVLFVSLFLISFKLQLSTGSGAIHRYIVGTVLIFFGGNLINGLIDVKVDAINKPDKEALPKRLGVVVYLFLNLLGLAVAPDFKTFIFFLSSIGALFVYSMYFQKKPLIGNLLIALLTALSLFWLSEVHQLNKTHLNWICVFSFLIQLMRELVKDIEDREGDIAMNYTTLPIIYSLKRVKNVLWSVLAVTLVLLILWQVSLWPLKMYPMWFTVYLLVVSGHKLIMASQLPHFKLISGLLKVAMVTGLFTVVFL